MWKTQFCCNSGKYLSTVSHGILGYLAHFSFAEEHMNWNVSMWILVTPLCKCKTVLHFQINEAPDEDLTHIQIYFKKAFMTLLSECYHTGFQSSDFIREQVSFLKWWRLLKCKRKHIFEPRMNLWAMTCRAQLSFLDRHYLEHWTASNSLSQQIKSCNRAGTFAAWFMWKLRGFIGW